MCFSKRGIAIHILLYIWFKKSLPRFKKRTCPILSSHRENSIYHSITVIRETRRHVVFSLLVFKNDTLKIIFGSSESLTKNFVNSNAKFEKMIKTCFFVKESNGHVLVPKKFVLRKGVFLDKDQLSCYILS